MKKLAQGAISGGAGTAPYRVPSGFRTEVTCIDVCNTTAGALTLSLYLVPTGGTAGTTNMLVPSVNLPAYTMFQWTGNQLLNAGDFIHVTGSSTGMTMNITGNEVRA